MAQSDRKKLDSGDPFPAFELKLTDGRTVKLPDDLAGQWTVLVVYRGVF